jgi:O-methyltransferase
VNINLYPIISDQISKPALEVVLAELERALNKGTTGEIVELGCYIGTTSLFIRRVLNEHKDSRPFHVYDSFEGLPPKSTQDSSAAGVDFKGGELAVSKKQFLEQFRRAHLETPITHKAWFNKLTDTDLPDRIAFAFLDGDFYESILTSLQLVWPRLSEDGIITIDDYRRETLPGVERAILDYFQGKSYRLSYAHNIATITKS